MSRWVLFAFISMFFAGFTSVIAKVGLQGISGDLGLVIRTCFVFVFVLVFGFAVVSPQEIGNVSRVNMLWLGISGATTALSWVFYYKAIKEGEVSTVALIDKGSVVVALLLAALILHETLTLAKVAGCLLIVAGLVVIARG